MNLCNSMAISCIQNKLDNLAISYLLKSFKTDLCLSELDVGL